MEETNFIYTLKDPISNEIRYVGRTNNLKSRLKRHMSNDHLCESWTSKNKWLLYLKNNNMLPIMEILDIVPKKDVNMWEIYWISQFKSWGFRLLNGTDGGDGFDWTGKKHSPESVIKMKMNHPLRKVILKFDLENNFLSKYDSLHEASEKTGIHRTIISNCCKGIVIAIGKRYYFRFIDNYFPCVKSINEPNISLINSIIEEINSNVIKYPSNRELLLSKIREGSKKRRKQIVEYDLNGNVINEYVSLTEASLKSGHHMFLISGCCTKKSYYTVGSKFWKEGKSEDIIKSSTFRYKGDPFDYVPYNKCIQKSSRKVCKYDLDGNFLEVYDSIKDAGRKNNLKPENISRCCKCKYNKKTDGFKNVGGFTWRFFDETNGEKIQKNIGIN
jgi:hypothetical protein